jgi:capsular exopolysaccharide synthesis family protein
MIAKVTRSLPDSLDVPAHRAASFEPGGAGRSGSHAGPGPLLQVLWRRRWTVLIVTAACLAASILYLLKATPVYTSASRLLVEQSGRKVLSDAEGVGNRSSNYLYTQAEVLTSQPILSSALEGTNARKLRTFAGVDNPLAFLKQQMHAEVGKKDDVITVSLDSPYPQEAAEIVNRVVDAYVTWTANQKRTSAEGMLEILSQAKRERDKELDQQVQAMFEFKKKNGAISFSNDKGNIILQQLATLSTALTEVQLEAMKARSEYEAAKAVLNDPKAMRAYVDAMQSKGVNQMDKEYGDLVEELNQHKLALATLSTSAGENNPRVTAVRTNLAMLEQQLADRENQLVEARVADAAQDLKAAQEREKQIGEAFEDQQKDALELNAKEAEYLRLESNVKRTEKACDLLDSRIKEINVNDVQSGNLNTQVLEMARADDRPTKPKKPLVLMAALMVGLALGTGAGLTRDWMDHRLRSAEDITASLGLPVLGVVPHMSAKHSIVARGQTVSLEPMSESAEAYRTVRTALFFGASGADAKTFLLTSPAPGDGKSTSASNLAIAMAQAGHRTLLIDCDFRKPTQHKIFELDDKAGLSSVIAGQVPLRDAIQRTRVARLQVLPCGPIPANPAEILNGKRFAQVMDVLVRAYDRIVIDSPPVMPVTDARILAASADVTLLVLRANKSTHRLSIHARDGLSSVGANVLGVIVNDVPRRGGSYGYGYGYGYYGTYGDGPSVPRIEGVIEGADTAEAVPENALERQQ